MEDGFHLNVAIVTAAKAWDWTPHSPRYVTTHFCAVYCGRFESEARPVIADFAKRFPQGGKPGDFVLSVTEWQARGKGHDIAAMMEREAQDAFTAASEAMHKRIAQTVKEESR